MSNKIDTSGWIEGRRGARVITREFKEGDWVRYVDRPTLWHRVYEDRTTGKLGWERQGYSRPMNRFIDKLAILLCEGRWV